MSGGRRGDRAGCKSPSRVRKVLVQEQKWVRRSLVQVGGSPALGVASVVRGRGSQEGSGAGRSV